MTSRLQQVAARRLHRSRRLLPAFFALVLLVSFGVGELWAGATEVRLRLPQRARLDIEGNESITLVPFLVVSQEGSENQIRGRDIDVQREFERYLLKVLRRDTDLKVLDSTPVDLPTFDIERLSREQDFWAAVGARNNADLVLGGSLDFDIQDKTGYRTEPFTSPYDGRTYYRQVLVEQTGFEYDILLQVYDGETGKLIYTDNFKDFQSIEGEDADPLVGMFENLYAIEDRLVNIFTVKEIEAARILFTD
jgi:hypothetical protein